ncbi:aldo/keto reductase [Methylovirgula sp. 4M-Z18]|uniref:aldo/keto reductase n=1 Tax=Methylovirgula sp. 4M-Z18 TaxID=2293567 RepID=UPI000E2F15FA|nr:aldo/keto reductase [Methylovirgula sp. 4M-Z18]RFB76433.1 aldo/keto reductase [Methylovirgula sp. 4M-Z18]
MKTYELGRSGLKVAPWAFGGNVFGWTADQNTSFQLLDQFVDRGFNLIDTADIYSRWIPGHTGGESETIIGTWLSQRAGRRAKVVIATKVGMEMADGKGLSRAHIRRAVDASLARLKTDYIDLYQSHEDDPATPLEETLETYRELIGAGKVRAIGASNYSAPRLAAALELAREKGLPRYETIQPLYNLYSRSEFEGPLAELADKEGLGVIPYYGLAAGFLTGKYRTQADVGTSARAYRVKDMINDRGLRILDALAQVGKDVNATSAQVALAWLRAKKCIPIASATSLEQADELAHFVDVILDDEAVHRLDEASSVP